MAYESFIGWRYLFRRHHSRAVTVTLVCALGGLVASGALFLWSTRPGVGVAPVWPVVALIGCALGAIVCGLLRYFSVFTTVAIVGVMLGVSALLVVLAVTSGFQEEFKNKVLGVNAHVIVMKWGSDFGEYPQVEDKLRAMSDVVGVAPFMFDEMQIAHGTIQASVMIKGIDRALSTNVLDVGNYMVAGSLAALAQPHVKAPDRTAAPGIVLGHELAKKLRVHIGDSVKLMSRLNSVDPSLLGRRKTPKAGDFRVVGIFDAGFDEYDRRLVYLDFVAAQQLLGTLDSATGVELKLRDRDHAVAFARTLDKRLGGSPYRIIDWEELNHSLFTALKLQKFIISLFLTIIVVVAAFNIVAALTMIVLNKRKEIAILESMGASQSGVARVFQVAGLTIGAVGVSAGIAFGLLMAGVAQRYGYPLDPKIYLIGRLPVHVRLVEVVLTAGITLAICLLATIYPSVRAAALRPVEGLRYE
jgi:lipoprotein-releasing system permease protein